MSGQGKMLVNTQRRFCRVERLGAHYFHTCDSSARFPTFAVAFLDALWRAMRAGYEPLTDVWEADGTCELLGCVHDSHLAHFASIVQTQDDLFYVLTKVPGAVDSRSRSTFPDVVKVVHENAMARGWISLVDRIAGHSVPVFHFLGIHSDAMKPSQAALEPVPMDTIQVPLAEITISGDTGELSWADSRRVERFKYVPGESLQTVYDRIVALAESRGLPMPITAEWSSSVNMTRFTYNRQQKPAFRDGYIACDECRGSGTLALFTTAEACGRCGGSGWLRPKESAPTAGITFSAHA